MKKISKKIVAFVMVLAIVMSAVSMSVFADMDYGVAKTGQCGDNVYWSFDKESGHLTISGTGDMWDDNYAFQKKSEIKSVSIESGVTSVGKY